MIHHGEKTTRKYIQWHWAHSTAITQSSPPLAAGKEDSYLNSACLRPAASSGQCTQSGKDDLRSLVESKYIKYSTPAWHAHGTKTCRLRCEDGNEPNT